MARVEARWRGLAPVQQRRRLVCRGGVAGVLGKGRLFFLVLALLAALNSQLAFSLPPWPEDKSPWRYLLRCRSSSLQDLSSSGTLLY